MDKSLIREINGVTHPILDPSVVLEVQWLARLDADSADLRYPEECRTNAPVYPDPGAPSWDHAITARKLTIYLDAFYLRICKRHRLAGDLK